MISGSRIKNKLIEKRKKKVSDYRYPEEKVDVVLYREIRNVARGRRANLENK